MKILFAHQNFPGQFKALAPALASRGDHVTAFTLLAGKGSEWQGVHMVRYGVGRGSTPGIHPWLVDFETKIIRGEACFRAALELKAQGYVPDLIVAHPGWGESLFLKDVWPTAGLGIYCEFYYRPEEADVGFDPEFPKDDPANVCLVRSKNINYLMHFDVADAGLAPTQWQASTFPEGFRKRITVVHEGVDTETLKPNPKARLTLKNRLTGEMVLSRDREIITFVNRNLEPYRGYHIFMRALPEILRRCPRALVVIVGGDGVSYGAPPPKGLTWKQYYINEIRPRISNEDWARVHFVGKVPYGYFITLLQISAVHVYLTYPFVLSWSLLEAMSVGCAIVASDTKPLHEALRHNETGRLFDFFDVSALAEHVVELLGRPTERYRLGKNARRFVRSHYDLQRVCLPQQLAWVDKLGSKP